MPRLDPSQIKPGAFITGANHPAEFIQLEDGTAMVSKHRGMPPRPKPALTDLEIIRQRVKAAQAQLDAIIAARK